MKNDYITIYYHWLQLKETAFYILLYIRLFAEDKKSLKCDVTDIKTYFRLSDTNTKIYEEIENLKQYQYISYIKGRRKKDYTLIINDDYMQKLVENTIKETDRHYEKVDKYINIEHYRKKLIITRATKQNIDIILHFNRDTNGKIINKHITSVKPIIPIKLYIYACSYDINYKNNDFTTYRSLEIELNETQNTIENASAFLVKCPLANQKYCKQTKENEEEKQEQQKRIKEGKQTKSKYIRPLGTTHYVIDIKEF